MMRKLILVALVGAAIVLAGPSMAFEQQLNAIGSDAPSASVAPDSRGASKGATKPAPTLEVPGIGNLGVIPKLDFGLELLYGDRSSNTVTNVDPGLNAEDDSLRVRGTIRHRF
jgi:hypothetical protein